MNVQNLNTFGSYPPLFYRYCHPLTCPKIPSPTQLIRLLMMKPEGRAISTSAFNSEMGAKL
jgi:hypothetical protein